MNTVRVYRLQPTQKLFTCFSSAQLEAAKVWNLCVQIHKQARKHLTCPYTSFMLLYQWNHDISYTETGELEVGPPNKNA